MAILVKHNTSGWVMYFIETMIEEDIYCRRGARLQLTNPSSDWQSCHTETLSVFHEWTGRELHWGSTVSLWHVKLKCRLDINHRNYKIWMKELRTHICHFLPNSLNWVWAVTYLLNSSSLLIKSCKLSTNESEKIVHCLFYMHYHQPFISLFTNEKNLVFFFPLNTRRDKVILFCKT